MSDVGADRAARLAARFQPEAPNPPAPASGRAPRVRRTYYIRRDLADWLDEQQRRLNYELGELGGLAKSRLLEALLEEARPRLDAIVERLRRGERGPDR